VARRGGESAEEHVEGGGAAVAGGVEYRARGGERGAGGVGLDEPDARVGGGGGVVEEQAEEARVRGAERRQVRAGAAGGHDAERGVAGRGRAHRIVSGAAREQLLSERGSFGRPGPARHISVPDRGNQWSVEQEGEEEADGKSSQVDGRGRDNGL
jgi:hypothetical protein